ncbi:LuxR C-terminal-related transcriptional regulator [Elizabethkingia anophelis]|uniref:LuxR C-terminal-related transcriptional regulator n=1 Tax=Elizabethkingia anophelis TaxID=1117645 RepID=UPI0029500034|nr:LuxR C-terminal-related transcriptional regulator [Elizabethkingia anophelis]
MKQRESKYYLTAKKFWKTVVNIDTEADMSKLQLQIEFHKRLLNIFQAGSFYYLIFNMYTGDVEIVHEDCKKMTGYDPEQFSAPFLMDLIHPDDKPYFLNFEYKVVTFFKSLPYDKIKNYKVQYDFRLKKKDGQYIRILHQAIQIDYDEKNFYRTLCLHTDITHIKPEGKPHFSLIGLDDEPSFFNIQPDDTFTKSYDIFTKREREILKCIVEGKSSKEIAEELFLSLHTVNTHRKNILAKASVKTPVDLVNKAIKEGWV